ncbi:SDR family oxidoreductase [Pseudomaricurvus alkylphenolicus]|uniref:SDR family NAD(P)-dependent oxidoreductase n=1 Tax=Pseudomaricurvus alkylphenolicus TaxID=1306991 RepID=UPI001420DE39|nr:SDR family oxidoreductase [Pseudomaricurvus alkylphenolicus]NIB40975.1 SDR family oxidoreductase [Pseudomaricurvus alkylphenolicus]
MFDLENKKAFITGGSSGIGRAIAELFIANGARVVIADIVDATAIADQIGAHYLPCNVADETSVANALAGAEDALNGKLDIVVLNAGVGDIGPTFEQTDQALIEKITSINQWGVLYGLKYAPEHLNDGGAIIATSSMASKLSMPGSGVYSAAKAAVNSMVSMAAMELGQRGIRVNSVCPGYVDTALGNSPEERRTTQMLTALARHADPAEDIAPVFLFLGSDASRYITGQAISVDGGMHSGYSGALLQLVTGSNGAPGGH